jgi:hypothetical protein
MIGIMKKQRPLTALLLVLALPACDSFLDVNENPNSPEQARVDLTLPAVIVTFGHSVLAGSPAFWGAEWTQQFSYNGDARSYSEIHRYELSALNTDFPWVFAYASIINEASNIVRETEANGDWAYAGIARFLTAWTYSYLSDMWGPIPFSESLDTRIPDPVYDDQKTVYEGVHTMLEQAITDMQKTAPRRPGANDLLFGGDMARWIKLARTVQARLHLRMAYAPGENTQDRAQKALTALQQGLASNADDPDLAYPGKQSGYRQPFYTFEELRQLQASEFYVELLRGLNDPRLGITVRGTQRDSPTVVYRGHKNGTLGANDSTISRIGSYFSADSAALNWTSYADAKFIEAEARLITGGAAAADAPYRAGIRANMEKMRVPAAAITAYLAARPALTAVANPLQEIMTQKYIANFLKAEAWTDWRRTGYPRLEMVERAVLPGIPQRLRTPATELASNSANAAATGIPTGLDGMAVKVWWASGPAR